MTMSSWRNIVELLVRFLIFSCLYQLYKKIFFFLYKKIKLKYSEVIDLDVAKISLDGLSTVVHF